MKVKKLLFYCDLLLCFFYISQVYFGGKPVFFGGLFKESRKIFEKYKHRRRFLGSQTKKKKKVSYPGVFTSNKTLGFLVSAEERDKATRKNYQSKVYFRCRCF